MSRRRTRRAANGAMVGLRAVRRLSLPLLLVAGVAVFGSNALGARPDRGGPTRDASPDGAAAYGPAHVRLFVRGRGVVRLTPAGTDFDGRSAPGVCRGRENGIAASTDVCEWGYPRNARVKLVAVPARGSTFYGWSEYSCRGSRPCFVDTGSGRKSVTAIFSPLILSVQMPDNPYGGSVVSNPAGIRCPPTCEAEFPAGARVALFATPNPGSTFTGWPYGCRRIVARRCEVVVLDESYWVGASFDGRDPSARPALEFVDFELAIIGNGRGTVHGDVPESTRPFLCTKTASKPETCSEDIYRVPRPLVLHAQSAPGSVFAGWSASPRIRCGLGPTCAVPFVVANKVKAVFLRRDAPRLTTPVVVRPPVATRRPPKVEVALRLTVRSRVELVLRSGGTYVAQSSSAPQGPGRTTVLLRLPRRVSPGRYVLEIRVVAATHEELTLLKSLPYGR